MPDYARWHAREHPQVGADAVREAREFMLVQPWLATWPGLAITATVLAWNFLGPALRDLLDSQLRLASQ